MMIRSYVFLATLVASFAGWTATIPITSDGFEYHIGAVPDWVQIQPVAAELPETELQGLPLYYLLSDQQIYVNADTREHFFHVAMTPLTEAGLEEASELEIEYNPLFEKLTIHEVTVLRNGQTINKLRKENIKLMQREKDIDLRLYLGVVSAMIILDDVRLGDIVRYAYTISGTNPVLGRKFFSTHSLGWAVPVAKVSLRIDLPRDRNVHFKHFNTDIRPQSTLSGDRRIYQWQAENVPAYFYEGDYPKWYDPFPWVQISEYDRWKDVIDWARPLYEISGALSDELTAKIEQWRRLDDPIAAASEALRFVQEKIRYFGVELGQNSHRPTHPNRVLEKRYGDCKDKTLMLVTFLRELGIEAYPALVSMRFGKAVNDWLPSPGAFDHVIVMAQIDGRRYWLDGTRNYQRGRLDTLGTPDFGYALVIGDQMEELVNVTEGVSQVSQIIMEEHFKITSYDDPVTLEITTTYTGNQAELYREYFANNSRRAISNEFYNYYARQYPYIQLDEQVRYEDDQQRNRFTVYERYRIRNFWDRRNDRLYFSVVATAIKPYAALPRTLNRQHPLAHKHPIRVHHTTTLDYPNEVTFDTDDAALNIDNSAFRFVRRATYRDRTLKIVYDYESKSDVIMPQRVPEHISDLRTIGDSLFFTAWISAPGQAETTANAESTPMIDRLLDRLDAHPN